MNKKIEKITAFIEGVFRKRNATVFLLFFIFSCILWFLIKLSDSYTGETNIRISYKAVPSEKIILGAPPQKVKTIIEGRGFQILSFRLFGRKLELDVSKALSKHQKNYFTADAIRQQMNIQFSKNITIQEVLTDTVFIDLGINKRKKIPVIPQLTINYVKDYALYDSLIVDPSHIIVSGPEDIVDTIYSIATQRRVLDNINSNIEITEALILPKKEKSLSFSHSSVIIKGQVVRFSEKILKVPVIVTNKPIDVSVRLFPNEVRIVCRGRFEDLKNSNMEDFMVVCDYNSITGSSNYMIPSIKQIPEWAKEAELLDKKIEFLIKRE
ncbi:YbbR-like domain-containing protein [Leptobacterium sp. I13]|uniref:YbbR-like domain-containing protein n=1 Tax=Leptobacterium meishanense TaxID=3128904 RepID=UPI0030ED5AAC